MSRANEIIANIYNPLNQDKQSLLDGFVVREKEFNAVFRFLKSSKLNQTSQNFLIQGQRGSGKTTLLTKLRYEIEDTDYLSHLLVIQFTEEQYNIFSLDRLWEAVADILEDYDGFEKIADEMEASSDEGDLYELLSNYLSKNKKKLVLLIDNFGDILDKLSEKEHKKLRDILHETDLQIIAASTKTLEEAYRHDKPFFESFKTIYLDALTKTETETLLEKLSSQHSNTRALEVIKNQKGRIETIRRLTGGIPRTIILLYEIFLDDSANVFEDLERILDKTTPLYKHKMDDLPTQQQVIVDAIALHWDGMLPSEISKITNFDTRTISSQLKILERRGLIKSKRINKKNKIYILEERFFNIWYLMRYGRKKKKQQVRWLVSFLKEWCSEIELIEKAKAHISNVNDGMMNQRGAYYMAEALSQSIRDKELKCEILMSTKKYISQFNKELAMNLSDTDKISFEIACKAIIQKDFEKAEKYCLLAVENKFVRAMYNLALLYSTELKDFEKAEKYYLLAVENKHVGAMNNLAFLYKTELKDFEKAEKYYLLAVENNHVGAMYNLAFLYHTELKDYEKAEKYYLLAVENKHVEAMYNLAFLYHNELNDPEKAEKYYLLAVENKAVKAMNNLALLYHTGLKDYEKAEKYYLLAVENKDVGAMYNLALFYNTELNDIEKAKQYYVLAVTTDFNSDMDILIHAGFTSNDSRDNYLSIFKQFYMKTDHASTFALSIMQIHAKKYKESIESFYLFLDLIKGKADFQKCLTNYFILMLSRKQYHLLLGLFQDEKYQLKEKIKPVYFALMSFMQNEYPREFKRMGSEISDTVDEILENIKLLAQ
ncbi:AAA family ATPase [bacterium]|nr:AAA family ATPase [bacterium]